MISQTTSPLSSISICTYSSEFVCAKIPENNYNPNPLFFQQMINADFDCNSLKITQLPHSKLFDVPWFVYSLLILTEGIAYLISEEWDSYQTIRFNDPIQSVEDLHHRLGQMVESMEFGYHIGFDAGMKEKSKLLQALLSGV